MKTIKILCMMLSFIIVTSFFISCGQNGNDKNSDIAQNQDFNGLYDNLHDYDKDIANAETGIVADFESEEELHKRVSYLSSYNLNPEITLSDNKKFVKSGDHSVHIKSEFPSTFSNIWDAPKIFIEIPKVERNLRDVDKLSLYMFNDSDKDITFALDIMTPDFTKNANTDYRTLKAKSQMEAVFDISDKLYYMKTNNYGFSLDNCCYFGIVIIGTANVKNCEMSLYIDRFKLYKSGKEANPERRKAIFEEGEINNFDEEAKGDYTVFKRENHLCYFSGITFEITGEKTIKGKSAKLHIEKDKIRAYDSFPSLQFADEGLKINNFSGYKYLEFYIFNDSDRTIEYEIEIHSYTDKFDYDFWNIEPGIWHRIIIPVNNMQDVPAQEEGVKTIITSKGAMSGWKDMNIAIIKELRFVAFSDAMFENSDSDVNLYIDEIRLVR